MHSSLAALVQHRNSTDDAGDVMCNVGSTTSVCATCNRTAGAVYAGLFKMWLCLQVVCIDRQHGESPTPLPDADFNYHSELSGEERPWRTDLKPLNILQPEGPSFKVGQQSTAIASGTDYSQTMHMSSA